jgi:hypothetical protein
MPIRQEIACPGTRPVAQSATPSNRPLFSLAPFCMLICFAVITCCANTDAFSQDTKPQAQKGSSKVPGVALYNLLQEKSIVFPDIAANTQPLSSGQKFQLFVDNSISVHTITWAALGSSIGQADNSPTGFGQGWDAYAKRFGSSMARQSSSEFFGTFILASAMHQDPRFYPEANPSFGHAIKYSVQRIFVTRNDEGRDVGNWSGLAGPLMAEGLANVYWPERNRTVGDTFLRFGLDVATRAGGNMLREYWPTFYGKINHAHRPIAGHN